MSLKKNISIEIVIACFFIGILSFFLISSQTSKWVYITRCYYNPVRYLKNEKGFLNFEKNYNGIWYDWNRDGSLAFTTELKDGFQNGEKKQFPFNIIVSNGIVKNNNFTGIENFYENYSINKKKIKDGVLICSIHNYVAPNYIEIDYFKNEMEFKKLKFRDGEFKLELYKNGKVTKAIPDLIELSIIRLDNNNINQFGNKFYLIKNEFTDQSLKITVTFEKENLDKDLNDNFSKDNMYILECNFEKGLISIFHFRNNIQIKNKEYSLDSFANLIPPVE